MPTAPPKHRPPGWKPAEKRPDPEHAFYGTAEWKRLRAFVRKRDNCICGKCGAPHAFRVDHRIPRKEGGSDDPSNLWCLCNTCDARKHRDKGFR